MGLPMVACPRGSQQAHIRQAQHVGSLVPAWQMVVAIAQRAWPGKGLVRWGGAAVGQAMGRQFGDKYFHQKFPLLKILFPLVHNL